MHEQTVKNCLSLMSFIVRAGVSRQITIIILRTHNVRAMGRKQPSSE